MICKTFFQRTCFCGGLPCHSAILSSSLQRTALLFSQNILWIHTHKHWRRHLQVALNNRILCTEQLHWRKERLWTFLRAAGSRETFYFFRVLNSCKIFWNPQPSCSKCIYLLKYSFIWISWLVPLLNILEKRNK